MERREALRRRNNSRCAVDHGGDELSHYTLIDNESCYEEDEGPVEREQRERGR